MAGGWSKARGREDATAPREAGGRNLRDGSRPRRTAGRVRPMLGLADAGDLIECDAGCVQGQHPAFTRGNARGAQAAAPGSMVARLDENRQRRVRMLARPGGMREPRRYDRNRRRPGGAKLDRRVPAVGALRDARAAVVAAVMKRARVHRGVERGAAAARRGERRIAAPRIRCARGQHGREHDRQRDSLHRSHAVLTSFSRPIHSLSPRAIAPASRFRAARRGRVTSARTIYPASEQPCFMASQIVRAACRPTTFRQARAPA